ncbi:MAG: type II secretion system F family protein [Pseudomonadota bacterium]
MKSFTYTAEDAQGQSHQGTLEAATENDALTLLSQQKLTPLALQAQSDARRWRLGGGASAITKQDVQRFLHRFSTLLTASVSLGDALALLARGQGRGGEMASALSAGLRGGKSLAASLEEKGWPLSRDSLAMIRIGEETGTLGAQIALIVETSARREAFRKEVQGQLIYPMALVILIMATLFFLAHFVLPQFEGIFAQGRTPPPAETALVLAAGQWIRDWGWLLPSFIVGAILLWRGLRAQYTEQFDAWFLTLPILGKLIITSNMAAYCRSLGALLQGGCGMAAALPIARAAVSNQSLQERHAQAADTVRMGSALSQALDQAAVFDVETLELIRIGERSGKLGDMLTQCAALGEEKVGRQLKQFSALLGPVLTALMGLLTAGVIGAVMIGVMSLNEVIS